MSEKCPKRARSRDAVRANIHEIRAMKLFLFLLLLLGQAEALFKSRVAAPKVPAYKAAVSSSRFPRGKVVPRSAADVPAYKAAVSSSRFPRGKVVARSDVIESEPFGQVAQVATDLTITALRLGMCALMVHHGLDKIQVRTHAWSVTLEVCAGMPHTSPLLPCHRVYPFGPTVWSHYIRLVPPCGPTRRACTRTPSLTSLT